jgi:hypothetical protein
MKKAMLLIIVLIAVALIYSLFFNKDNPLALKSKIATQSNPFIVPFSQSDLVWNRAQEYVKKRYRLISGDKMQLNDSVLFIPYFSDYHKGNSLEIKRAQKGDSVQFRITLYNSGKLQQDGSKEIALFMATGIDKYNYKE